MKKIYAFIPARSGSERVKNKNLRLLQGKPLIEYTLDTIQQSKYIQKSYISSDYENLEEKISRYDNTYIIKRPKSISNSKSLDIEWVLHLIDELKGNEPDLIVLLRPTSPFRSVEFLDSNIEKFKQLKNFDSARAIRKVKEHPDKMWVKNNESIIPYNQFSENESEDLHSKQYQSLEEVYVQTSSLEILNTKSIIKNKKLSGKNVFPIFSNNLDSFTIDYESDFVLAEKFLDKSFEIS